VPQSDDKSRGFSAREASRLRAILGSEPSSGYAFHDEGRVERLRPGSNRPDERAAPQAASHAPRERSFQQTLVGSVTVQEALAGRPVAQPGPVENDQGGALGEPGRSWPPLPHVPSELEGSLQPEPPTVPVRVSARPAQLAAAPPNPSSTPPIGVSGGAIWQALPSVVDAPAEPESAPIALAEQSESVKVHSVPARNSRPSPWRGSLTELEPDVTAYGDARVLKYEPLVARAAWDQLQTELTHEAQLPPALELLSIIAQRETIKDNERERAAQLTQRAIGAFAQLLQLPESSPTALLLGKRLLRKNPGWGRTPSPSTGLSVGMLLAGIAAGAGIGWLVTRLIL
jgi:hypothetical protein